MTSLRAILKQMETDRFGWELKSGRDGSFYCAVFPRTDLSPEAGREIASGEGPTPEDAALSALAELRAKAP